MTKTEHEKLIDRIMKMYRKAESTRQLGNEAEANIFMDAVQKLLAKHKLEMSDIELAAQEKEDPVKYHIFDPARFGFTRKKRNILWYELLAAAVARAHFCELIPVHKSNRIILIGRRQDRQVAEFMIITLTRLAEQWADKAYVKRFYEAQAEGDVTQARGYRGMWLMGFADRVYERYEEMKKVREVEHANNPHALMIIRKENALVKQVKEEVLGADRVQAKSIGPRAAADSSGFEDGRKAGDQVNLSANAVEHVGNRPKVLSQGQKLLGGGNGS